MHVKCEDARARVRRSKFLTETAALKHLQYENHREQYAALDSIIFSKHFAGIRETAHRKYRLE